MGEKYIKGAAEEREPSLRKRVKGRGAHRGTRKVNLSPKIYGKRLDIIHHQGNTNQNYNITTHLSEGLKLTTQETTGVGKDGEKGNPSDTVGGNANRCSHSRKQYEVSSNVMKRTALGHLGGTVSYATDC